MNLVLILYPKEFKAFSKFERKLSRIFINIENYSIIYPSDPNGFIKSFFKNHYPYVDLIESVDWENSEITHAIIIDDGEVFPDELEKIKSYNIPYRLIYTPITRVVNIKNEKKYNGKKESDKYAYIGRGSYWGNPYSMYESGEDREEVIRKFKYDFDFNKFPNKEKSEVYKLAGKRLGCFCKPEHCHGDILADFLNQWDDGK